MVVVDRLDRVEATTTTSESWPITNVCCECLEVSAVSTKKTVRTKMASFIDVQSHVNAFEVSAVSTKKAVRIHTIHQCSSCLHRTHSNDFKAFTCNCTSMEVVFLS